MYMYLHKYRRLCLKIASTLYSDVQLQSSMYPLPTGMYYCLLEYGVHMRILDTNQFDHPMW